jgi:aconitate hydratase
LQDALDALGFHVVGFGCTTCVGNSGDLKPALTGPDAPDLLVSLLSGNRNFENRIHPAVGANYLASPPLVVAGALAGNLYADLSADPLGHDRNGQPVFLRDIWPDPDEIAHAMTHWRDSTAEAGDTEAWRALDAPCTPQFPGMRYPPSFSHRLSSTNHARGCWGTSSMHAPCWCWATT